MECRALGWSVSAPPLGTSSLRLREHTRHAHELWLPPWYLFLSRCLFLVGFFHVLWLLSSPFVFACFSAKYSRTSLVPACWIMSFLFGSMLVVLVKWYNAIVLTAYMHFHFTVTCNLSLFNVPHTENLPSPFAGTYKLGRGCVQRTRSLSDNEVSE